MKTKVFYFQNFSLKNNGLKSELLCELIDTWNNLYENDQVSEQIDLLFFILYFYILFSSVSNKIKEKNLHIFFILYSLKELEYKNFWINLII